MRTPRFARRWNVLLRGHGRAETPGSNVAVVALAGVTLTEVAVYLPEPSEVVDTRDSLAIVLYGGDHVAAEALIGRLREVLPAMRAGYSWSDGEATLEGLVHVARQALATGRQGSGFRTDFRDQAG